MGRGNVCVFQKYEDLLYVDRDYFDTYIVCDGDGYVAMTGAEAKAEGIETDFDSWDEIASLDTYDNVKEEIISFIEDNSSFRRVGKNRRCSNSLYRDAELILENKLYEIAVLDNEWSYAFLLVRKETEYGDDSLLGLQKKHFGSYFKLLKEALFLIADEVGTYKGAWTSGTLTYDQFKAA